MSLIIPRWEWRTFGARFGAADAVLAGLTPTGVEESDELYFLSDNGDNVKVRAEIIDIKVLREVDIATISNSGSLSSRPAFRSTLQPSPTVFDALRQPVPGPRRRRPTRWTSSSTSSSGPGNDPGRLRPQAAGSLHDRRLHGRGVRHRGRWSAHAARSPSRPRIRPQ